MEGVVLYMVVYGGSLSPMVDTLNIIVYPLFIRMRVVYSKCMSSVHVYTRYILFMWMMMSFVEA